MQGQKREQFKLGALCCITIAILDIIHNPVLYLKYDVSGTALSPSSGGTYSGGSNRRS
jgi:hypothetical protein